MTLLRRALWLVLALALATPAGAAEHWKPWPNALEMPIHNGVTLWHLQSGDGTVLDLMRFDFAANPRLRLELYDQDEGDPHPGDGRVGDYEALNAAEALRGLQAARPGRMIAAWNGLFFNYDGHDGRGAAHVAPVVLRGQPLFTGQNYRWTVGVQQGAGGRCAFRLLHLPDETTMARTFTYAAGGAQALIKDGRPLRLQPAAATSQRPVPSTPDEVGAIPGADECRTARTSFGWSRDSRQLYLLIVKPAQGTPSGGCTLADLQRFWAKLGVWEAVNVDGGAMTQLAYRRDDERTLFIPPLAVSAENWILLPADGHSSLAGGSLMYFYIREAPPGEW